MGRAQRITREVQRHDRKLFCKENGAGLLCIFRKSITYDVYDFGDDRLVNARPTAHLIFALTDTWTVDGVPVERGVLPILQRLQQIDSWNRPNIVEDLIQNYEKEAESQKRKVRNEMEAFASDFRSQFARATNDVRVANLNKVDSRRIKDGSSK